MNKGKKFSCVIIKERTNDSGTFRTINEVIFLIRDLL